jgi:hypothetical protein
VLRLGATSIGDISVSMACIVAARLEKLTVDLEVRGLGSEGLPEHMLDDDERWALLWRCLRDESLSLRLRVAGSLVLLYGQIPSRVIELTADSVTTTGSDTYLALRAQPVLLPPPLAALITQLVALNSPTAVSDSIEGPDPLAVPRHQHRITSPTRSPSLLL